MLTIAVGVYRKNRACAVIAFMWWGAGGALSLYNTPEIVTRLRIRPPGVYEHVAWVVGAVPIWLVFLPVFTEYAQRITGRLAARSRPTA